MAGVSSSGPDVVNPYGGFSPRIFGQLGGSIISPLLRGLGFGGGANFGQYEQRLQHAGGPLADLIRGIQGFEPSVMPEAQAAGQQATAQGSAAYQQAQQQVQAALGALPGYQEAANQGLGYAQRFAQEAFSPVSQQPLYLQASRQLLDTIRPGLAARGIASSGAGQQAETDASRNLAFQVEQQQAAQQQAAIPQLQGAAQGAQQLSQAGIPIAGQGMDFANQLGTILQQQYGIPMQAIGNLMQILTAGQAGALGLGQATAPQVSTSSKGVRAL